jgi:hypothetical protein
MGHAIEVLRLLHHTIFADEPPAAAAMELYDSKFVHKENSCC